MPFPPFNSSPYCSRHKENLDNLGKQKKKIKVLYELTIWGSCLLMFWCISFLSFFYGQIYIRAFKNNLDNRIILYIKCLEQYLTHSKHLIMLTHYFYFVA